MTGFLDGLFEKPGDAGRLAAQRQLEARRDAWDDPNYFYRGAGDFLLRHGQWYPGRELPDQYAHLKGEQARCFDNALAAAEATPELSYVEGVYSVRGWYKAHAWCVDADGVVEVTFATDPEEVANSRDFDTGLPFPAIRHWAYWGAVLNVEYVRDHREKFDRLGIFDQGAPDREWHLKHFGIDGDLGEYPILRRPFDPNRRSV